MLIRAKHPIDVFGKLNNETELKKSYKELVKQIHPDTSSERDKYISTQGFQVLQDIYKRAQEELKKGIYDLIEDVDIYSKETPLFEIKVHSKNYQFFECICNGEISDIYKGLCNKEIVCLKLGIDENDNNLLKSEYEILNNYSHHSLPIVRDYIKINGCSAIVMDEIKGKNLVDIMKDNPNGLKPEIVMWVMERLFSAVGYLHSNFIIHGNIIPDNIMLNGFNHNASLTGFSFHISKANEKDAHYQIRNEDFSAPEVNKTSKVLPQSDIYSLGKLAIYMLGGSLKTNGMPLSVKAEVREFIRRMVEIDVNKRPNDAWKLWDEWRDIRVKVYGKPHYIPIEF